LASVLILAASRAAPAGDWPQILGPHRNGKADGERIVDRLPPAGPKLLWQRDVGSGYAGPAVVPGRVVLFHRRGESAVCEALNPATGRTIWKVEFPTRYSSSIAPDDGPRCVPLIHKQSVFVLGADGDLHCISLDKGKQLWSRDLAKEFGAEEGYFGLGSSPIVEQDRLLVNVGGRDGAGIIALSIADGKLLWKATDEAASYSSPIVATIAGHRQAIFVTRLNLVGLDPSSGAVRFRIPFGMRGPTVNGANPLLVGDHLFLSSNYGVGARWIDMRKSEPAVVWDSDELISSQYTTSIEHEGTLYGVDGRQDAGVARLRAIDPVARKVLWTEEDFGTATLILADGKLLIMKTDATLVLASPSPKAYRQLGTAKLFDGIVQALPALSEGKLYARDVSTLKCYDLAK